MQITKSDRNLIARLRQQLLKYEDLQQLDFDDPRYEEWRQETARILDEVFGFSTGERHPCTRAFMNHRIPDEFTASRAEMQDYYANILRYQADLLKAYIEDIEDLQQYGTVERHTGSEP